MSLLLLMMSLLLLLLLLLLWWWSVRGAGLPVDGEAEVRGELQPAPRPDGEARGAVCQLSEDRPAHGLPQRVLRPPQAAGRPHHRLLGLGLAPWGPKPPRGGAGASSPGGPELSQGPSTPHRGQMTCGGPDVGMDV